jgi:hypothetical protein
VAEVRCEAIMALSSSGRESMVKAGVVVIGGVEVGCRDGREFGEFVVVERRLLPDGGRWIFR